MNALFDAKNEDGLELLADLIEPIQSIALNKEVKKARDKKGATQFDLIRAIMKNCKKELITIFALLDGAEIEGYEISAADMMKKMLNLMNDPEVMGFFS